MSFAMFGRRRVPVFGAALVVLTLTLATPAGARRAHDQYLNDADNAILKAIALVDAVQLGTLPPRPEHRFELHLNIARFALQVARQQLDAAADVQDAQTP